MRYAPTPLASGEFPLGSIGQSFVYLMYDSNGEILYVGVTDDLSQRIAGHATSEWRLMVQRVEWQLYPSRRDAERAESHWIRELLPEYNVRDNGRRLMAGRMGHRRPYSADAWRALGVRIRAERSRIRWSQKAMAADAGIPIADLRALERGESTRYERWLLDAVESILQWHPGSIESILAGGDPQPLTEEERQKRAFAEHARLSLGDRI